MGIETNKNVQNNFAGGSTLLIDHKEKTMITPVINIVFIVSVLFKTFFSETFNNVSTKKKSF